MKKNNIFIFSFFSFLITIVICSKLKESKSQEDFIPKENCEMCEKCEFSSDGPICSSNGKNIIIGPNIPKDLVAHYSFEYKLPIDESGNKNHGIGEIKTDFSFNSKGNSARFSDSNYIYVPHNDIFNSVEFTIMFWIYFFPDLDLDEGSQFCPLIQKGLDKFNSTYERAPAIFYDRFERHFQLILSIEDNQEGIKLESYSKINPNRWYNIAAKKTTKGHKIKFYINGFPENYMIVKEDTQFNNSPYFIGNTPPYQKNCFMHFLIDDIKIYRKALRHDLIQAEAAPLLGGIDPDMIRIGCLNCTRDEAEKSCLEGYELCTSVELHTAGYQIARGLGLISSATNIWTKNDFDENDIFKDDTGLGLCCNVIK